MRTVNLTAQGFRGLGCDLLACLGFRVQGFRIQGATYWLVKYNRRIMYQGNASNNSRLYQCTDQHDRGLGFRVQCLGFRARLTGLCRVQGLGFRVQGLGFRAQLTGLSRVQGLGFRVQGLGRAGWVRRRAGLGFRLPSALECFKKVRKKMKIFAYLRSRRVRVVLKRRADASALSNLKRKMQVRYQT